VIPRLIIWAYQNGPLHGKIGTSNGASTRALADIAAGRNPWSALWQYGRLTDIRDRSSWGGPQ
jgi:hypothetical protein